MVRGFSRNTTSSPRRKISTVFEVNRNPFGKRTAWLLPDWKTVVRVVVVVSVRARSYSDRYTLSIYAAYLDGAPPLSCLFNQPKNSPYQSLLLRGFRIQWFSSGNHSSRASTPLALSVL